MTCLKHKIDTLRRPRLLICAARFGIADYRREQVLPRFRLSLSSLQELTQHEIVAALIGMEEHYEAQRIARDPGYRVAKHVELMIALMAETQLLVKPSEAMPQQYTDDPDGAARPIRLPLPVPPAAQPAADPGPMPPVATATATAPAPEIKSLLLPRKSGKGTTRHGHAVSASARQSPSPARV